MHTNRLIFQSTKAKSNDISPIKKKRRFHSEKINFSSPFGSHEIKFGLLWLLVNIY